MKWVASPGSMHDTVFCFCFFEWDRKTVSITYHKIQPPCTEEKWARGGMIVQTYYTAEEYI